MQYMFMSSWRHCVEAENNCNDQVFALDSAIVKTQIWLAWVESS